jgi:hypothetical protein
MPTVKRINNWLVMIYTSDHQPAHVHIIGPGWTVVVNLQPVAIREFRGCSDRQAVAVRAMVATHRLELMAKWKKIHG